MPNVMITTTYFPSWPYDDALTWMQAQHEQVAIYPSQVRLGIGSHQETVITVGKNSAQAIIHHDLLKNYPEVLVRHIERGGGATLHEPGQIVLYPVMNLAFHQLGPKDLVLLLENSIKDFVHRFGLKGEKRGDSPGIFVDAKKIGFIGLRIKEGISSHGLALNIMNTCSKYQLIDPCGISGLAITSMHRHIAISEPIDDFLPILGDIFVENFRALTSSFLKRSTKILAAL